MNSNENSTFHQIVKGEESFIHQFVYHMVPKDMQGQHLFALNDLKNQHPDLYDTYMKKYEHPPERKKLKERNIPRLNCKWNDVIHLLTLHPHYVYHELHQLGVKVRTHLEFYKIPIHLLKGNQNALYLYQKEYYRGPNQPILPKNRTKRLYRIVLTSERY